MGQPCHPNFRRSNVNLEILIELTLEQGHAIKAQWGMKKFR